LLIDQPPSVGEGREPLGDQDDPEEEEHGHHRGIVQREPALELFELRLGALAPTK
jgi:hypothetical protein